MEPTDNENLAITVATFNPATTEVIAPAAPALTVRERVEATLLHEMEFGADGNQRMRAAEILLGNGFVDAPVAAVEATATPAPKKRGRPKKVVK